MIRLDSTGKSAGIQTASTATFAHTNIDANRILVVSVGARAAAVDVGNLVVTGITYNGVALTKIRHDLVTTDASFRSELWYLVNPTAGTNNVVVTWTGNVVYGAAISNSFTGVDLTSPIDANNGTTGTATTITVSVTVVAANALVVDAFYSRSGTITKASAQTLLGNVTINADDNVGASSKANVTSGIGSMDWTESADGNDWAISVASLKPIGTQTTNRLRPRVFAPGIAR